MRLSVHFSALDLFSQKNLNISSVAGQSCDHISPICGRPLTSHLLGVHCASFLSPYRACAPALQLKQPPEPVDLFRQRKRASQQLTFFCKSDCLSTANVLRFENLALSPVAATEAQW